MTKSLSQSSTLIKPHLHRRQGSVVVIVLWTIAVAAIITSSLQLFAQRQATIGREAVERAQARWAARAGMEATLAAMTRLTEKPFPDDAKALRQELLYLAVGETHNASWRIEHEVDGVRRGGPMDEHSKFNINRIEDRGILLALKDMTFDVLDAISDWIDEDDEANIFGVERDYYLALTSPYQPRNGPMRNLGEIELVAGVWPRYFRGEDWNLNNRRDANEDDGSRSFPPDESDAYLDAGWSGRLTVYSRAGGATDSGQPRIHLKNATAKELIERLNVNAQQAEFLIQFGSNRTNSLTDLLFANPASSQQGNEQDQGGGGRQQQQQRGRQQAGQQAGRNQPQTPTAPQLSEAQIRAVLAETSIEDPLDRVQGKMNLNTISQEFLRDIFRIADMDEAIADEIIYMRESRPQGIPSMADLIAIPNLSQENLQTITRLFDTASNVFTITSRGRAAASGLEVEIIAVVDRSTVPVQVLEYREH